MRKGPVTLFAWWGGKLAQGGRGRALPQPASPAWDGQSPKVVLTVGTEEGSVRQQPCCHFPWVLSFPCHPTGTLTPAPVVVRLWAVSPSPTGPLSLWRTVTVGGEATALDLLAKTTWLPSYARTMCPAKCPFPCSSPQCSSASTHSQGTTPNTPISALTLPSHCGAAVSKAQPGHFSSLIPNQFQTQQDIIALSGTSALPHQGPGTVYRDGDRNSHIGLPSPGICSPLLANWRRTSL